LFAALLVGTLPLGAGASDMAQWLKAGVPAADRQWTGSDYAAVAEVLSAGKLPLPSLRDDGGRAVLERLTSTENLSFHRNPSLPLQARMEDIINVLESSNRVAKLYLAAAIHGDRSPPARAGSEPLHDEIARLIAFELHVMATAAELVDEYLPTMPRDDRYETRIAGMKRFASGVALGFVGALQSLSEKDFYSPADLSRSSWRWRRRSRVRNP